VTQFLGYAYPLDTLSIPFAYGIGRVSIPYMRWLLWFLVIVSGAKVQLEHPGVPGKGGGFIAQGLAVGGKCFLVLGVGNKARKGLYA